MTSLKPILMAGVMVSFGCSAHAEPVRPVATVEALQAERLRPWATYVTQASQRFGIPKAWIEAVIMAESGGRMTLKGRPITSHAGAMGLMQLMPGTYEDMRKSYSLGSDPYDPQDNILAGTAYLRTMYDRFGYPGLFAAYNAGPQRYEQSLRGVKLPKETQDYLAKLTRNQAQIDSGLEIFVRLNGENLDTKSQQSSGLFVPLREDGSSDD